MKTTPQFMTFTGNVNGATLKTKQLKGKNYLVGPVIMAREIVMNALLYTANELKASVPHWNGCPAVLGHPQDDKGNFLSANSPDILEEVGVGSVFNTKFDTQNRLCAELWIEEESLEGHKELKDAIDEGEVIEVSTGLYYTPMVGNGTHKARKYKALACNIKPDHLAILLGEKGACSVEDGAGFPRANKAELLEVNALSGGEIQAVVGRALKKNFKANGWSPYLVDLFPTDNYVIFDRYSPASDTYDLYKVSYEMNADETAVTFKNTPTKVMCKKSYVDIVDEDMIQKNSQDEVASTTATPPKEEDSQTQNGEQKMNKAQIIAQMLASNKIDAEQAKVLEGLTDAQFAVYQALQPKIEADTAKNTATPPPAVPVPAVATPVVATNKEEDSDKSQWMQTQYTAKRNEFVAKIVGNKGNQFTKEELEKMSINALEKMSALVTPTVDMAGAATTAGTQVAKNAKEEDEVVPYVFAE